MQSPYASSGYRPQSGYAPTPAGYPSSVSEAPQRYPEHQGYRPPPEQSLSRMSDRPSAQSNGYDRRVEDYAPLGSEGPPRALAYEQPHSRIGEELQQQRSHLNISPETFRRQLGRASPLPQAVQGAQAQLKGPGGDPSIKSEFGRMFSGLGSGLGGQPGVSTPTRGSPLPYGRMDGADLGSGELDSLQMVRSASRGLKNKRRAKEEDGRAESEVGDRVGTPLGSKRIKSSSHHHHPHIVQ